MRLSCKEHEMWLHNLDELQMLLAVVEAQKAASAMKMRQLASLLHAI